MSYEINVSRDGRHYFATHPRSMQCLEQRAIDMFNHFCELFPAEQGYEVSLSYSTTSHVDVARRKRDGR